MAAPAPRAASRAGVDPPNSVASATRPSQRIPVATRNGPVMAGAGPRLLDLEREPPLGAVTVARHDAPEDLIAPRRQRRQVHLEQRLVARVHARVAPVHA